MAYDDKTHRHERQVKVRLAEKEFAELREVATQLHMQHSVLAREVVEAFVEIALKTGQLPFELKKQRA